MKNSKIISNGNQGFLCVDTQENLNQMCQWKVRLTYIKSNSDGGFPVGCNSMEVGRD